MATKTGPRILLVRSRRIGVRERLLIGKLQMQVRLSVTKHTAQMKTLE